MTIQQTDLISQVSVFFNQAPDTIAEDYSCWLLPGKKGSLMINFETDEFEIIDYTGDIKTYFALVGLALSRGFTYGDYFTDKK
jgi:hypothetical protein